MRAPIFVKVERFNLDDVASDISDIRGHFDSYLDSYPVKSSRSKHSLMGPVGKVLQEVRSGKWDAESVAGFALNIHLSNPRAKGFISAEARVALREGIEDLIGLLGRIPVTARDRVVDRVDYGLYFVRRAKGLQWLEEIRQAYIGFLREKYRRPEQLAAAWGGKAAGYGPDFSHVGYPSRRAFEDAKGKQKADMAEFAEQAGLKGYELPDEEEE